MNQLALQQRLFRREDIVPKDYRGEQVWEYPTEEIGIALARVEDSEIHHHLHTTEWYMVKRGEGNVIVDGVVYPVAEGDMIEIRPGEKHKAVKTGDDFEIVVISRPRWSPLDYHKDREEVSGKSI